MVATHTITSTLQAMDHQFGIPDSMVSTHAVSSSLQPMDHQFGITDSTLEDGRSKKLFDCDLCSYSTDRKNNLKRHISTMHEESARVLECCNTRFSCKAALRNHSLLFHKNGYCCNLCGRNFCRKALLKRHLSVHSGQKDFACSLCHYATSHKSNLERHKKVHHKMPVELHSFSNNAVHDSRNEQMCAYLDPQAFLAHFATEQSKINQTSSATNVSLQCSPVQIEQNDFSDDGKLSQKVPIKKRKRSSLRIFATPYKCSGCRVSFSIQTELENHFREYHPNTDWPQRPIVSLLTDNKQMPKDI